MNSERIFLTQDYSISRVINGGWQLSDGHALEQTIDRAPLIDTFNQLADDGFTTFDCADIYTGVEALLGQFIAKRKAMLGYDDIEVHTKFVPDLAQLHQIDYRYVERIIHRSLQRLNKERLDLVQLHWWDYDIAGCLTIADALMQLQKKGLIAHLGTTNFDTHHLKQLVEAGYPLVSNQVQYSVLDRRPEREMVQFCQKNNVSLLCYGTLAGGFLSERYLGQRAPTARLENRSLVKYQLVIEDSLGWEGYQALLNLLKQMAERYQCDIANVASAYMLQKEAVAAVIIGTRSARHIAANKRLRQVSLLKDDISAIEQFLAQFPTLEGEPFALERLMGSKHRNIMKMNLSEA